MTAMLHLYDLHRRKTAVLQNAFDITEMQELNQIYTLKFSLPSTDEKTAFVQPFHFARYGENGELYRIINTELSESETPVLTVTCEHVIATLCDDLMFGAFQYGGGTVKTADVINFLLGKQKTKNWELAECDFVRRFEYNWEQENILNALYSIPKEFSKAYKWTFDTLSYPWKLSLKTINETVHPEYYIRAKRNLLSSGTAQDFADICTRIYPLGYGEGVNQLGIKEINNGVPYLENTAGIAQYGVKEKVLVDRRFENAESLKEYAQTMLDALSIPSMSRSFDVVDLYPLTSADIDLATVGDICKLTMDDTTAYITKTVRILDQPGNLQIDLSTKATDVASTVADLADRVRIESVYAQGATQLYQHSKDANATPSKGMIMSLYFPSEMKQINKVLIRLKLGKFRSYSQTTDAGGASTRTSSESPGSTQTTTEQAKTQSTTESASSTVGTTQQNTVETTSTESGGGQGSTDTNSASVSVSGTTETKWYDADWSLHLTGDEQWLAIPFSMWDHSHSISLSATGSHSHSFSIPSHSHRLSIPSHSHQVTIPAHKHSFTVPSHKHNVSIPKHSHTVTIPDHTHNIAAGIFESGNPKSFKIFVDGKQKASLTATSYDGDITTWLLDARNQIPRDSWIDIEIRPNDLAYVQCSVFVQGFVQSRGGGNY